PNKIKRPPPPGIQTNGASSSRSSPSKSPSMSAKRPPTAGGKPQLTPTSASVNGVNGAASRQSISRSRRETSTQAIGRNGRNNGLRSASMAFDMSLPQAFEPRPEVITDSYILKKYAGNPPSLIIHLYPNHFRFDKQDGIFPYKSPMRIFLDHVRSRTIPHDLLVYLNDWGIVFYDGRLIVQIHDHKSAAQAKDVARPTSASSKTTPFSIHNYNPYITPSPYVPYPKENLNGGDGGKPAESKSSGNNESHDQENMPAPAVSEGQKSKDPPQVKIFTVVLHPTPQSLRMDLMIKATTPVGSADAKAGDGSSMIPPQTPMSAVPPTPTATSMPPPAAKKLKREKTELAACTLYAAEGQILLATADPLYLEPTKNVEETIALLEHMTDARHSEPPPKPKTRKRTVAERAADEAIAAEHEKYMLTWDDRLSSNAGGAQGSADGAEGNGQSGGAAFEPRFERLNVIQDLQREHLAKKEQEKARQAEQERKLQQQRLQQQQEQAQLLQQRQQEERQQEAARRRAMQQQQQQAAQQAQAQAAQAAQAQAAAAQSPPNMQHTMSQASHGHPTPVPMSSAHAVQAAQRFSQAGVSSPVVRQNTPQNMSSPMVGHVPMQQTNSGMGGSPQRPSSVVQNHQPMSAPMAVSMSARGSQQSHAAGTPRMPSATPQMPHGTPPQMMNAQQRNMQLINQKTQQLYQQNVGKWAAQFGGIQNVPPEAHDNFKRQCRTKAQEWMQQQLAMRNQQAQMAMMQQQQQHQQQQGMNGMNGMHMGM
ncbi:Spt20 family-domain-containing protein, partial [Pseudomassariella vexata]